MQKLFDELGSLDRRCCEAFALSEDILMEHAAQGMSEYIRQNFALNSKVIVACGSGNNGADGLALARLLHADYQVEIFYAKEPSSQMALLQAKRVQALHISTCQELSSCDVLVDAIIGTGLSGSFNAEIDSILKEMNKLQAFKIACDIPSGIQSNGICAQNCFVADVSLTMGALKKSMFLDEAKAFVGEIKVLDLGVSRRVYEGDSNWNLLDLEDLKLPHRGEKDSHKGSYGHLALACGNKAGASIISAQSALRFGAGLVTLVGYENVQIPEILMYSHPLPANTTALACGMGLGNEFSEVELENFLDNSLPMVADADIFHMPILKKILQREDIVLTPHAKEFVSLLKITGIADVTVEELQKNRFKYVEAFCAQFPHATLLLKGASVILACGNAFYINPHGTSALAKGGSGDVLSGLVGALLAQGYTPLQAAIHASLAHTKLAINYKGADFSLTPRELIEGIANL